MTFPELCSIAIPRFGPRWQSALARAIGAPSRTMRRLAAGQRITPAMEHRIRSALGDAKTDIPRDEWMLASAKRHRYLIHARKPRFIALIADKALQPGDLPGIVNVGPVWSLCEIVWIDAPPPEPAFGELFARAHKNLPADYAAIQRPTKRGKAK